MNLKKTLAITLLAVAAIFTFRYTSFSRTPSYSQEEAGFEYAETAEIPLTEYERKLRDLENWKRPEGPVKVALQAGHWRAYEAPDEFPNLKTNTGTSGGGYAEWEVNLAIAREAKALLEHDSPGITVEILPATIPPGYWADVFVAIHADGNLNASISGYKTAAPRRDMTGKAQTLSETLEREYGRATKLRLDPSVTRNMTGYYAFNWRRYEHSLHPMTAGDIIETGFLTNAPDRKIIAGNPKLAARGIADGILTFLKADSPQ